MDCLLVLQFRLREIEKGGVGCDCRRLRFPGAVVVLLGEVNVI